jgi:hypothetical protein
MEKGKESEFPEGRGGLESAKRILMKGVPPIVARGSSTDKVTILYFVSIYEKT